MKFKVDENLPTEITDLLNQVGHDAVTVFHQNMVGAVDPQLASICQAEGRILVTLDLDFSDLRTYPPQDYPGFIVLKLKQQDKPYLISVFTRILPKLAKEPLARQLWIVEEERIRIRGE